LHLYEKEVPVSELAPAVPQTPQAWTLPNRGKVGMASLIIAESAIFTIFVVAYVYYTGKSLSGPTPREVLERPIFFTICLLSSSITIHLAEKALELGKRGAFLIFWFLTIFLGGLFLFGTGREWYHLIYEKGLTISTNLFGTTYYSLVGLHAFHVTAGLIMLSIVLLFAFAGRVGREQSVRIQALSMYWHFVDVVWIVVFTVVYIVGR
jgi:cytochrome c oxidase subunit III